MVGEGTAAGMVAGGGDERLSPHDHPTAHRCAVMSSTAGIHSNTDVREAYGLSAQLAIRCIANVCDAYTLDKQTRRTCKPHGTIAFDDRILSYDISKQTISIWTLDGRLRLSYHAGDRQKAYLAYRHGESDVVSYKGAFYLLAPCDIPDPNEHDVEGVLGVDIGMVNRATDSDGNTYTGHQIEQKRQWYVRRRATLQKVDTPSAKRRLKQLSGTQKRFQKDVNHCISTQLVATAKDTLCAIAREDLTHIRQRTERTVRTSYRSRHSTWAFAQLRQFISYTARMAGVPVFLVDPAYTSQTWYQCGHVGRHNRTTQAHFCCQACGHTAPADVNAARNISYRAAVNQTLVSSLRAEAHAQVRLALGS